MLWVGKSHNNGVDTGNRKIESSHFVGKLCLSFKILTTFVEVVTDLVGAQVGVSGRHFFSKDVMLTGRLAFGLFANFIDQGGEVNSSDNRNLTNTEEQDDTGFAQMVEFSPTLHIRLQEKMFLSFGGTMMWLNGVNRASKDYVNGFSTDGGATDANQSYFYYGGKATLKWTFN